MIRTKPPNDAYRDNFDRVFRGEAEEPAKPTDADAMHATMRCPGPGCIICKQSDSWPNSHESDCPFVRGEPCRCPIGNL